MKLSVNRLGSGGHHLRDVIVTILFCEDLITDDAGVVDPQLSNLAKFSSVLQVLQLGGVYELVEQFWTQFSLSASCVNIDICWSRSELLVSIPTFSVLYTFLVPENYLTVPEKLYLVLMFLADVLCAANLAECDAPTQRS